MKRHMMIRGFLACLPAMLVLHCTRERESQPVLAAGEFRLAVPGGNIWYKVSGVKKGAPVVLLHGGPGFSSFYLKPFEEFGDDRQVIRYDQLGGGKSDRVTDTTLFTIAHFVAELDSLRRHLGCPAWHVVGHSWGGILALEYYRSHPDRVLSMTFASAMFDVPAFGRRARELLNTLPAKSQEILRRVEETGEFADSAYQKVVEEFYALYVFRNPVMEDLDSSFATFNQDVYGYMWGASEFSVTGTLKSYDATSFLPQITVPVLLTVGEFDEVDPARVREDASRVPGARFVQFAGAAHMTPWDARDESIRSVREFLRSADSLAGY